MDKKDVMYVVAALVIILVIAVVIKPLATGRPVNTGIVVPTPSQPPMVTPASYHEGANITSAATIISTTLPTPPPTPPWNQKVQSVGFVDPSTYHISMNDSIIHATRIDTIQVNNSLTTYATISGQSSGTTQVINIPFPYWELWYSADPSGAMMGKDQSMTSTIIKSGNETGRGSGGGSSGKGSTQTVIQGSFSVTNPTLSIQVMDANDPNRIVRTISPPGGLDVSLWNGGVTATDNTGATITIDDPRPWKEKFFEGQRSYYFVINAHELDSYNLKILVPSHYVA
jgi:hypothetical protein